MPQPRTDAHGLLLTSHCALAEDRHHKALAVPPAQGLLKQETDVPPSGLGGLWRIAPGRGGGLGPLTRLLGRAVQPRTPGGRLPPTLPASAAPRESGTPVSRRCTRGLAPAGLGRVAPTRPPAHEAALRWEGAHRVRAPRPFGGRWRAPAGWRLLAHDARHGRGRRCGRAPALATPPAQHLASPPRATASGRTPPAARPAEARADGGWPGLATGPARTVSPGPHRAARSGKKRGRSGAARSAWAVGLWRPLPGYACTCRPPLLLPRLAAGWPGRGPCSQAAARPMGLGIAPGGLAAAGRRGFAFPPVDSRQSLFEHSLPDALLGNNSICRAQRQPTLAVACD